MKKIILKEIVILIKKLKVKDIAIFLLILISFFMYYKLSNSKKLNSKNRRDFEIQIGKLNESNVSLSSLSEELLDEIDSIRDTLELLKNKEEKIKIIYVQKYKNIDKFNSSDIANEFKSIFPDSIH